MAKNSLESERFTTFKEGTAALEPDKQVNLSNTNKKKFSKEFLHALFEKADRNYHTANSCGSVDKKHGVYLYEIDMLAQDEKNKLNSLDNNRCEYVWPSEYEDDNEKILKRNKVKGGRALTCFLGRLNKYVSLHKGKPNDANLSEEDREHKRQILYAMLAVKRCVNCTFQRRTKPDFFEIDEFIQDINAKLPSKFRLNPNYKPPSSKGDRLRTFKRGCPVRKVDYILEKKKKEEERLAEESRKTAELEQREKAKKEALKSASAQRLAGKWDKLKAQNIKPVLDGIKDSSKLKISTVWPLIIDRDKKLYTEHSNYRNVPEDTRKYIETKIEERKLFLESSAARGSAAKGSAQKGKTRKQRRNSLEE